MNNSYVDIYDLEECEEVIQYILSQYNYIMQYRHDSLAFLRPYFYNDLNDIADIDLVDEIDMAKLPEYIAARKSQTLINQYYLFKEASERIDALYSLLMDQARVLLRYMHSLTENIQDYLEAYASALDTIRKRIPYVVYEFEREYAILREMLLEYVYEVDGSSSSITTNNSYVDVYDAKECQEVINYIQNHSGYIKQSRHDSIVFFEPYFYSDLDLDINDEGLWDAVDMSILPEYIGARKSQTLINQYNLFEKASDQMNKLYYRLMGFELILQQALLNGNTDFIEYLEAYASALEMIRKRYPSVVREFEREYTILREMVLAFEYGVDDNLSSIISEYL